MSSLAPGRLNIFALGTDHFLHWKYKGATDANWTDYHRHERGGKWALHGPVSISRVVDEISVFMVSLHGSLKQSNFDLQNTGDLGPWKNLGGELAGPPAVTKREGGILHIFYIGTDHALHHKAWDGAVYTPAEGFEKLEGDFTNTPTAISTGPDDIWVFAIGRDNRLYRYHWQSAAGWSAKEELPGHWVKFAKAISPQPGSIDVFGIDASQGGNITHISSNDGKGWKLETVTGSFHSLDAISVEVGSIDIFAFGDQKTILHRRLSDGTWQSWENLMGMMTQPPTAVSHTHGIPGVICVGQGGAVFYKSRNAHNRWSIWHNLKGVIVSRVG